MIKVAGMISNYKIFFFLLLYNFNFLLYLSINGIKIHTPQFLQACIGLQSALQSDSIYEVFGNFGLDASSAEEALTVGDGIYFILFYKKIEIR